MENLNVNEEKFFAFEINLLEKVTEEYMFQFLMSVNAFIF